ncbi:MAG: tRNA (adenosine(37)-N6)-dimethylallyltransferase MiaA [Melioribacteraceae bacterium]
MNKTKKVIVILGPTAVGKTKFAVNLAYEFNGEIISADSRQVYIGMDIGSGKDLADYTIQNKIIKTHLIDILKPHCEFNLYLFQKFFYSAYQDIVSQNHIPFLVGGTGLYLSSVIQKYSLNKINFNSQRAKNLENNFEEKLIEILKDLNPNLHNTTDLTEKKRIISAILIAEENEENGFPEENLEFLIIGINEDREILMNRIRERLKIRLKSGMIEEVENLLKDGISHEKLRFFGLEYKFVSQYLTVELNYNDMYQKLASAIIQFSKRQMTWFRKMEKEGIEINWMKNSEIENAKILIRNFLE